MRAPRFWSQPPTHPLARVLAPLGHAYGWIGARRMDRPGLMAERPVLCVGNFTLGGAGKTPTALALSRLLAEQGLRAAFLTRGYGGRLPGPVRVDPAVHDAAAVGDEPLLLARAGPTIVARDRPAGAGLAVGAGADVIVMDDGLQNPSLTKTLAFAVIDAAIGLGNGLPFPAGPLRVPLARQWPHADALVVIGEGRPGDALAASARARGLPVHRARLVADGRSLAGRRVLAFAGIGRPDKFFATLAGTGAVCVAARGFPDHHRYRAAERAALVEAAARADAALITTEKDWVRLPPDFAARVETLPVTLAFEAPDAVAAQVLAAVARFGRV